MEYTHLYLILIKDFQRPIIYSLESASGYGGKGQKTVEFGRHLGYNMRASLEGEKN